MPIPVVGTHTVHELRNLWDAYSFELQAMNRALASAWDSWHQQDPAGFASFNADYARLSQAVADTGEVVDRLTIAAGDAQDTTPAIDPYDLTGGDQFNVLAAAFATGDPAGSTTPGPRGFNDLDKRFRAGPAASMAPTYVGIPQPDAPDLTLQAYQLADAAMKAAQKVVSGGTNILVLVGLGILAGVYIARR